MFEALHDATLRRIEIGWLNGEASLSVRTDATLRRIVVRSLRELHCSRTMPWGPSESINEVRGPDRLEHSDLLRLEIDMQSGDTIRLVAAEFEMVSDPCDDSEERGGT
jgi:hypothetical protein